MRITFALIVLSFNTSAAEPALLASGLKNPESVCIGPKGLLYITEIGERDTPGDGRVCIVENGQSRVFCDKLDDPRGIIYSRPQNALYLTDNDRIIKVDATGKSSVFAAKFPTPPKRLNDIAIDEPTQMLLVSDSGDRMGSGGAIYRITIKSGAVETLADAKTIPGLHTPNGVTFDNHAFALVADMVTGKLHRIKLADRSVETVAEGFVGADGLAWDRHGRLFVTLNKTGTVMAIPRPGETPVAIVKGLASVADCCLSADGMKVIVPDMKSGTLLELATAIPGWEVDTTPAAAATKLAFPNLIWTGWDDGSETGKVIPLRPIALTHAGDGSSRHFVAIQQGVIHVFDDQATATKVFLDITKKVRYLEKQNEEGLLGLCFHPKFKTNGEFFVFYTEATGKNTNVVSRFRVSKTDPNVADPASEEVLLRIEKPYWNHDGGTILFGPDGCLYITHGDGGLGHDPHENGQNLKTLLGKILRIDVDRKDAGRAYAIPADNPFAMNADALPEIYAYGLRNVWRMSFDAAGRLWAADVGQGLYEEINLVQPGGNYGWSIREGLHPFGKKGVSSRKNLREPIWEYDHEIGKSITGGLVYRGSVTDLKGKYLYADYVSQKLWALTYDEKLGRVTGNQPIAAPNLAVMSFGEDERGEAYIMGATPSGRGIYRITVATP